MLKDILKKLGGETPETETPATGTDETQLAYAALLVEAARADEEYTDKEKALISALLQRQFDLEDAAAAALREEAETARAAAHDLYRFSSRVKSALAPEEVVELLEAMWEVILSDEARDPYEDMLMRRLGGLIHAEDTTVQAARRRVAARLAG